ncbi:MAG: hypothetical protein O7F71_03975 [Gammaproteobacteria bacterium]|nr:hypothetical protein [Gammaproteobacteria bacterium]
MNKKTTVFALTTLLALFCFRVSAQLVQWLHSVPWLPDFESWHSGALPYAWLLVSQGLIIIVFTGVIVRIQLSWYGYYDLRVKLLLAIGWVYFAFMLLRFVLSVTLLPSHPWFGATLPALFHIVLATMLLVLGYYEKNLREN